MVCNSTLRYHAPPVRHVCIVSVREDARGRKFAREEGLWPWLGRMDSGPGFLAVAGQTVNKNDTEGVSASCSI